MAADHKIDVSRRSLMAGAALAAMASAAPMAAQTAPKPTPKQMPGIHKHKVGSIDLLSITDGTVSFPRLDNFVSNVPADEVARTLEASFLPTDAITLTFTPVVLNTSGRLVVIDTGVGEAAFIQSNGVGGQFRNNLAAAGYSVADVDQVLITHFHADHIGGLVTADNKPAFPNAQIYVPAAEYAYWMDSSNMPKTPSEAMVANFKRARRIFGVLGSTVKKFDGGVELAPGVTSMSTHGHTPGHSSFIVTSGADKVIIQGDVTTHPALFIRHPNWHGATDMDPVQAEQTRRRLYDQAVAEKTVIYGFHFPFPALGHLAREDDGYRLVSVMWNSAP
ncbi:MBL fold metallo-hydrolase [Bradyrhizobium sp. SSBR45G]|uniref:MBL fold metallo-hydrolase n=1 Tax=unclassified Bradyrhizobium TaxID=2631580 RepID=UPI002342AC58|nr:MULTISPECIES: MBL fold metallo-hydrolase [unclassified Bradyrhizobium]GLH76649.1 MBL fold metallo-hydrolase [Bradyrhizobium sp. SSBR45G]GLH84262.1 MBL fold metallo-hydrolase [Bradyrhizobium sp. SSBR45R]